MAEALLDTNILLRFLTGGRRPVAGPVNALFRAAERQHTRLVVVPLIVGEVIHVLATSFRWPRQTIAASLLHVLSSSPLVVLEREVVEQALLWYGDHSGLDFEDAYIAALSIERGHGRVISFDRDIARLPGVHQIQDVAQL